MARVHSTIDGRLVVAVLLTMCPSPMLAAEPIPAAGTLERALWDQDPGSLALEARERGDAARGALVFFQRHLACTQCHTVAEERILVGPDLAQLGSQTTGAEIVDAILRPSKTVKKGFEAHTIATRQGAIKSGPLVEEQADRIVLRDVSEGGAAVTILKADIEERRIEVGSIMPGG
ncbi:MAG TPA: hypothetical protein VGY53_09730, partial [Isosphaeraceae bacterium]|nr:hypothetical protein [Isosphaeraceae bacterium]